VVKETGDMRKLQGRSISHGLAAGKAFVYRDILYRDHERYDILNAEIEEEYARFQDAIRQVLRDLRSTAQEIETEVDGAVADIFRVQEAMLLDPVLLKDVREELDTERVNAEQAVKRVFRRWEHKFRNAQEDTPGQPADDIADLGRRLLRRLIGIHAHTLEDLAPASVVVARRLLPSDTVFLSRLSTEAAVLEFAGPLSHAALLTRELGVPAVSEISGLLDRVVTGDRLLVDGNSGAVIVNPDEETAARFETELAKQHAAGLEARKRRHEAAKTADGIVIDVSANVSCREDVESAVANGAEGIGLYRIEGAYLSRLSPPSEDEILGQLEHALEPMKGKSIVLRLLDAGADKELPFMSLPSEPDPFLGRRGVRLLLAYPELLTPQLHALLRLSQTCPVRILVPMVTLAGEMVRIRQALKEASHKLAIGSIPPLGAMIETPAAALCAAEIASHADFLSIGTNDLTQYTMAAGRENPSVGEYFLDEHPAVWRLIQMVIEDAGETPVSICGELAGSSTGVELAAKSGIRALSVSPPLIPGVKDAIREMHVGKHDTI